MSKLFALPIMAITVGIAIWQLCSQNPAVPRSVLAVLLVVSSLLAGLRIGTDYAMRFTKDLERKNKYLAEENNALADLNLQYLKDLKESTESKVPKNY